MAELVGLAASVTGLLGVGVAAVETSRSLRKLSRDIKFADKDIRMLDVAIRAFRNEIGFVHDRLIPQLSKPNRLSIFDYLERRKVFDDLLTQSKLAQEYIERLRPKINSLKSSIGMMTKLKWAFFKKQDIRDIGPQMETLKSSLTLIMMTVVMEGLLEGVQTEETQNEM